ncbi:MAG TPA: sigma-54 dependent transcriptional regulator, partial [Candidatus Binatia bacterium]|nr:sigma-54 dependent transcriptional regulator [Candidatus Binatia bacterium]
MATILIVDDEPNIRSHLATFVRGLGHTVEVAGDGTEALAALDRVVPDVVLTDVRMAGMDGMTLLQEIRRRRPEAVVVLMTAYATVAGAVEAMRAGAYDYLVKPFSLDAVSLLLDRVLEVSGLRRENRTLRRVVEEPAVLTSTDARMQRVLETARQVAASDATVLLTGESGTGKNVLAAAIHRWSPRAAGPFVTIACTTLSEHLLESELFGHVKGAFTSAWRDKPGRLEAADGGTVFLDEVGELPPELQAKLLRFLEERRFERVGGNVVVEVDVRIVAATNRELEAEVAAGRFRRDLFYRLNVVALELPPLRERRGDLQPLITHALATLCARHHREMPSIEPAAASALAAYAWPGNVRELVNALEHALVLARDGVIRVDDLPDRVLAPALANPTSGQALRD